MNKPEDRATFSRHYPNTGKRVFTTLVQMYEQLQLRRQPNRITRKEYFDHGLDDDKLSWQEKCEFLGNNSTFASTAVNNRSSFSLARDKIIAYSILALHDLPYPAIAAIIHPSREFPGAVALKNRHSAEDFLRTHASYPLFAKPTCGNAGFGSIFIESYHAATDTLQLRDGSQRSVTAFVERAFGGEGTILQEIARPHSHLEALMGPRLATARVVVLVLDSGPIVHRAVLRIPVGSNMIDNFQKGITGNLLGAIDVEDGSVFRIVGYLDGALHEIPIHPDTQRPLLDMTLPDWPEAIRLCVQASAVFAGLRLLSWDVAFTDRGIQLIEVNGAGDVDVLQLASRRGIADATWWKLCYERPQTLLQRVFMRRGPWLR